jgi:hypothetical protein
VPTIGCLPASLSSSPPPQPARGPEYTGQQPAIHRASASAVTAKFVTGSQWHLPPIDHVVYLGSGGKEIDHRGKLGGWFEGVLALSAPQGAGVHFNDLRKSYNATHLLCARRGGMPSWKPRVFTTAADAWLFRQYAYQTVGVLAGG